MSRITASIETVLPEPDSPTIPRTSPRAIENERPSTARTRPSSVRNETPSSRTSSSGVAPFSGTADPGIQDGVDDVDGRVRDHDEEGGVHDRGHDHGQVEVLERVVRQPADPVQPEDDLRQERGAADERAEVEAEEADERDQRRAQRVTEENPPLREPLRACGAHV